MTALDGCGVARLARERIPASFHPNHSVTESIPKHERAPRRCEQLVCNWGNKSKFFILCRVDGEKNQVDIYMMRSQGGRRMMWAKTWMMRVGGSQRPRPCCHWQSRAMWASKTRKVTLWSSGSCWTRRYNWAAHWSSRLTPGQQKRKVSFALYNIKIDLPPSYVKRRWKRRTTATERADLAIRAAISWVHWLKRAVQTATNRLLRL